MTFWEAMREMQENGKKVRCETWHPECYFEKYIVIYTFDRSDLEHDWEEYQEPEKLLSFSEMVKGLREGKKFARKSWASELAIFVMGNEIYPRSAYGIQNLKMEDFESTVWFEVH